MMGKSKGSVKGVLTCYNILMGYACGPRCIM